MQFKDWPLTKAKRRYMLTGCSRLLAMAPRRNAKERMTDKTRNSGLSCTKAVTVADDMKSVQTAAVSSSWAPRMAYTLRRKPFCLGKKENGEKNQNKQINPTQLRRNEPMRTFTAHDDTVVP